MKYRLGYRPDPARLRTQMSSRVLVGAAPVFPEHFSAEHLEAPIFDQNDTGSCIGHGTAQGTYVAHAHQGDPLPFVPSPGDIYMVTRASERARETPAGEPLPLFQDVGGFPADAMAGLARWGVRALRAPSPQGFDSDVDPSNVNDEPPLADLEANGRRIVTGQYRITEYARDFIPQLCASVVRCGAAGIGVFVDRAFMRWDPSRGPLDVLDLDIYDPEGGGHWLTVTSFYTLADGTVILRGPNSWTRRWGDNGHFEITERWVQKSCSDAYAYALSGRSTR